MIAGIMGMAAILGAAANENCTVHFEDHSQPHVADRDALQTGAILAGLAGGLLAEALVVKSQAAKTVTPDNSSKELHLRSLIATVPASGVSAAYASVSPNPACRLEITLMAVTIAYDRASAQLYQRYQIALPGSAATTVLLTEPIRQAPYPPAPPEKWVLKNNKYVNVLPAAYSREELDRRFLSAYEEARDRIAHSLAIRYPPGPDRPGL